MKKQTLLKITAVLAIFFGTHFHSAAQGNFDFTNNTPNPLWVELWADSDDCLGTYLCSTGFIMVPSTVTQTFNTPCTANGAWKYMIVTDFCGKTAVGVCGGFPLTDTFVDCTSATILATWVDEHTGNAN